MRKAIFLFLVAMLLPSCADTVYALRMRRATFEPCDEPGQSATCKQADGGYGIRCCAGAAAASTTVYIERDTALRIYASLHAALAAGPMTCRVPVTLDSDAAAALGIDEGAASAHAALDLECTTTRAYVATGLVTPRP